MIFLRRSTGYLYKITAVSVSIAIMLQPGLVGVARAASQLPARQPLASLLPGGALGLFARI